MQHVNYTVEIHPAEEDEGGFWASVPSLPGCFTQGETYEETVANLREAILSYLEALTERGESIPIETAQPATFALCVDVPQVA